MKILAVFTILFPVIFLAFPSLDLEFSGLFVTEGQGFMLRNALISNIIYYAVRIITLGVLIMCMFGIFYDLCSKFIPSFLKGIAEKVRSKILFSRQQLTFLFLVIVITPGILVHNVFKPLWERARPVEVSDFGNQEFNRGHHFTSVFTMHAGQEGYSFPSGHAAMAFALVAFAYVVSQKNRKKVLISAYSFAVLVSLCRIWQGGHYLSDVYFSAILTLWTIMLLKRFYLDKAINSQLN